MKAFRCASLLLVVAATSCIAPLARAQSKPFLHSLFSDNMVLQRGRKDPIWGWTSRGAHVAVTLNGRTSTCTADATGRWMTWLPAMPAGGPFDLTVRGEVQTTLHNVMFGDVWICSGQSNMEMGVGNVNNAAHEISTATYPNIRLFTVGRSVASSPQQVCKGKWEVCAPDTVTHGVWNGFSAAGYFFGRALYNKLHVPIGLIHSSWGGTVAEAWTSEDALNKMAEFQPRLTQLDQKRATGALGKFEDPNYPTSLYNGMIAPLAPFGLRGAIWYQGESNGDRGYQYRTLLPTMITDWRTRFDQGSFPFYIVQLPYWQAPAAQPKDDNWAELREAQVIASHAVPNCDVAITIDTGDTSDIHPKDKQTVGARLADLALGHLYGVKGEYTGPMFAGYTVSGSAIRVRFTHAGGGLAARGGPLQGFAVAGADHNFVWAQARIQGGSVVVSAPGVNHPVAVRYAWAIHPVCNLFNGMGFPASPFRTDDFPGLSFNKK